MTDIDVIGSPVWNVSLEAYFSSLGERSHCLNWLHSRAEAVYSVRRVFIDLPVIVLSALTGFASVGSTTLFTDQRLASICLGVVSLFVSILNTTGSYFNFAKRAEAHRISAIEYAKLYRFVLVELSLPRAERVLPRELLRLTKDATDRLAEVSPLVPALVIAEFRAKFEDNEKYKDVAKPEITNGLEAITVFAEARAASSRVSSAGVSPARTPAAGVSPVLVSVVSPLVVRPPPSTP